MDSSPAFVRLAGRTAILDFIWSPLCITEKPWGSNPAQIAVSNMRATRYYKREVCEKALKAKARGLPVRGADHDGQPVVGTRPDTYFLGRFLLPLRLPRHLHRALWSGTGRRVLLRGGHLEGSFVHPPGTSQHRQWPVRHRSAR